jgi:hypothetical protein
LCTESLPVTVTAAGTTSESTAIDPVDGEGATVLGAAAVMETVAVAVGVAVGLR